MHTDKHKFMKNLILLVLLALVLYSTALAQEFKQVHDGIEYSQFTRQVKINDKETASAVVNALRLDLKKVRLDVHHAMDAAIGLEKTSSIAARHGAVAAVNAGFFRLDKSIFA
jgi:exopolysaccharide biosynthesis protein